MNTTKSTNQAAKGQSHGNSMSKEKSMNKTNEKSSSTSKNAGNAHADKTKEELLEMAKKLEITGRHDMNKEELIKAIDKHSKK